MTAFPAKTVLAATLAAVAGSGFLIAEVGSASAVPADQAASGYTYPTHSYPSYPTRTPTSSPTSSPTTAPTSAPTTGPTNPAGCADVDISFARGTGEAQGPGSVGGPFTSDLTGDVPGRSTSTYAVVYAAATNQSSAGAGSTDLVNHLNALAAKCPATRFVIGGYSQGATVIDKALGIQTATGGTGTAIPTSLQSRVAAVVVFGNPLGIQRETIAQEAPAYASKAKEYCNTGDPVCGNGNNVAAHTQYVSNGSAAAGAQFAAGKLN